MLTGPGGPFEVVVEEVGRAVGCTRCFVRLGDDEQAYFLGLPASGRPDDRAGDISAAEKPIMNQGIRK